MTIPKKEHLSHPTLFKKSLAELLKETGVGISELKKWSRFKWLSFSPKTSESYDEQEIHEIIFIKSLVRTGLTKETIQFMLSQLERPYYYRHSDIYWDFSKNTWTDIDEIVQDAIEERKAEIVAENLVYYLESLAENGDIKELKSISTSTKKYAARAVQQKHP